MTVLYFAFVKEKRGLGEEEIALPPSVRTLGELVAHLQSLSPAHARALEETHLRAAVNQAIATPQTPVAENDEVAFFPPMTGGAS
jgi:molybdopterin converting factor subunit 1